MWTYDQLVSECGLGDVAGLCGANCYHDYAPFVKGASTRTYTDEELDAMIEEENTPKEYGGKQYTTYEALQEQRRQERSIRATRQQVKLLETGGASKEELILKRAKYQGQMQGYKAFSDRMGLPMQYGRIRQDGLSGRFSPTKKELTSLTDKDIDYMSNIFKPKYGGNETVFVGNIKISLRTVSNSKFDMITEKENSTTDAVKLTERMLRQIKQRYPEIEIPTVAVVDFKKNRFAESAIAGYHDASRTLFVNKDYAKKKDVLKFVQKKEGFFANQTVHSPYLHELGHKFYYDTIRAVEKRSGLSYSKAKRSVDGAIESYINMSAENGTKGISRYASVGYKTGLYTEVVAESFASKDTNKISKDIITILEKMR